MQQKGFSIVELMIVIVVIGILASITAVVYSGVSNRAHDAAVQSDLETITGQLESYRVNPSNPSEYPRTTATLTTLGIKATKKSYLTTANANFIYCIDATYQSYALVAKSRSNNIFMVTNGETKAYPLTDAQFTTAALCPALSMVWVSSGMSAPNTWETWVTGPS